MGGTVELHVVVVDGNGAEQPLALSFGDAHRVRDLGDALGDHLGTVLRSLHVDTSTGSRPLDQEALLSEVGLVRGCLIRSRPARSSDGPVLLAVIGGPDAGRLLPLHSGPVVVGRGTDADLRVQDPFVSRRHCQVQLQGEDLLVRDLASANGTAVAGAALVGEVDVREQPLELGSTLLATMRRAVSRPLAGDALGRVRVEVVPEAADELPLRPRVPGPQDWRPGVDLSAAAVDAGDRLAARLPDLATLRLAAQDRTDLLWSRRGAPVALRIGWGPLVVPGADGADVVVPAAPVWLDLRAGPVHLTGRPEAVQRVGAALVLEACVLHAPGDVAVHLLLPADAPAAADWSWLPWLPHARSGGVHRGAGEMAAALRRLDVPSSASSPSPLVVVDGRGGTDLDALAPLGRRRGIRLVIVGGVAPDWAATHVEVQEAGAVVVRTATSAIAGMGADGVGPDIASLLARALAPLVTDATPARPAERPVVTDLLPAAGARGIAQTWAAGRPRRAAVGNGDGGVVAIPLDVGPVLFAHSEGTGVHGTHEALSVLLLSVATSIGPSRLGMVVATSLDHRLRDLPHLLPGPAEASEMIAEVAREVARRRDILRVADAEDWDALRRQDPDAGPRLLVVTDADADPGALAVLGREGAAAGIDLVLCGGAAIPGQPATPVRLAIAPDGTASLETPEGNHRVRLATLSLPEANDRLEVRALDVAGRPSGAGHTSLSRAPVAVDPVARIVAACREAAEGLDLPTWSPAPDPRAVARVRRTFVFTDIVGSTRLVEVIGDLAWADLVGWHDRTLRALFVEHHGEEVDHAGDGFLVAFRAPGDAIACSVMIQRRLDEHRREAGFAPRVRIGGHVAEVVESDGYKGHGLHVAARVAALADADEVIFSAEAVAGVVPTPRVILSRTVSVKGASEPVEIRSLDWR